MTTQIQKFGSVGEVVHGATPTISERSEQDREVAPQGVYLEIVTPSGSLPRVWLQQQLGRHISTDDLGLLHQLPNSKILLVDTYTKYLHPPKGMVELLKFLGINPDDADADVSGYRVLECQKFHTLVAHPIFNPHGNLSPTKSWPSVKSSASRLMRIFENLDDAGLADYLCCFDLTYPQEVSQMLLADFEGTLGKPSIPARPAIKAKPAHVTKPRSGSSAVKLVPDRDARPARDAVPATGSFKCLELFENKLRHEFYEDAELDFHSNTHPWSTQHPYHPHLQHHLNFPNVLYSKVKDKSARFWPWVTGDKKQFALNALRIRTLWAECIFEVFGVRCPLSGAVVDIHAVPLSNRSKLYTRLKYCGRHPIADFFEFFGHGGELPHDLDLENIHFIRNILYYSNPRAHRGLNAKTLLVNPLTAKGPRCPICHAPAHVLEHLSSPEKFFQEGYSLVVWDKLPGLPGWLLLELNNSRSCLSTAHAPVRTPTASTGVMPMVRKRTSKRKRVYSPMAGKWV